MDLESRLGSAQKALLEKVRRYAEEGNREGWAYTKEAMIECDEGHRNNYISLAMEAFERPRFAIAEYLLLEPNEHLAKLLKVELIKTFINVFDLRRRAGDLDEAQELGEKIYRHAQRVGEDSVILRAGNFLHLVYSAQGDKLFDEGNYNDARRKYFTSDELFQSLPTNSLSGLNRVMYHANRAANFMKIVKAAHEIDLYSERELKLAEQFAYNALGFVEEIDGENKDVWSANANSILGQVACYRGDYKAAVDNFRNAIDHSMQGANYDLQVAVLSTHLADAMLHLDNPNLDDVRGVFEPANMLFGIKGNGVVPHYIIEKAGQVRDKLYQKQ